MQINRIQNYQVNNQYNSRLDRQTRPQQLNNIYFSGRPKLETKSFFKKLDEFVDLLKSSYKETKAKKAAKKQALIDAENKAKAREEAKRIALLRKKEEMTAIANKNLEEERKLRQQFDNERLERYKKLHPASLAKEYRRCLEQNDIVWITKIKHILKSRGYALIDGKAVKEYTPKAYRPLEILPFDDIPNSTYAAKMIKNPPLVKDSGIMSLPTRGNYTLGNIGIYNFDFSQKHFGQIRFPETQFGANTGLEIPGISRGWTMSHSYRPNLRDYNKYHYCTSLSYKHEENYIGQAPGFTFLIEGDIQAKELEEIKDMFIENGLMEKLLKSMGDREKSTETFKEMAEMIVNHLNKVE